MSLRDMEFGPPLADEGIVRIFIPQQTTSAPTPELTPAADEPAPTPAAPDEYLTDYHAQQIKGNERQIRRGLPSRVSDLIRLDTLGRARRLNGSMMTRHELDMIVANQNVIRGVATAVPTEPEQVAEEPVEAVTSEAPEAVVIDITSKLPPRPRRRLSEAFDESVFTNYDDFYQYTAPGPWQLPKSRRSMSGGETWANIKERGARIGQLLRNFRPSLQRADDAEYVGISLLTDHIAENAAFEARVAPEPHVTQPLVTEPEAFKRRRLATAALIGSAALALAITAAPVFESTTHAIASASHDVTASKPVIKPATPIEKLAAKEPLLKPIVRVAPKAAPTTLKAAPTTVTKPAVTSIKLALGDNPWSLVEKSMTTTGKPKPTDIQVAAGVTRILRVNHLTPETARTLPVGYNLKLIG